MTARKLGGLLGPTSVVLAAAAAAVFDASSSLFPLDLSTLGHAADTLLSSDWSSAFASPTVQVGPLHLMLLGLLRGAARTLDLSYRLVFAVAAQVGLTAAVMATVRRVRGRRSTLIECGAGFVTIVGGTGWVAYISGHPEEPLIGLLWVWAAVAARRGRAPAAGLVLGIAAALKLTGVMGVPVLLLLSSRRDRLVGLATFGAVGALAYGPFLLAGDVQTFSYEWPVQSGLLTAVWSDLAAFPWWLRVLQGVATAGIGAAAVAWLARAHGVVWAVPLTITVVRILLDPQPNHYFWLSFEAIAVVGAAAIVDLSNLPRSALAIGGAYAAMTGRYLATVPGYGVRLVVGGLLLWLVDTGPRSDEPSDPAPSGGFGAGGEEEVARSGRAI